MARSRSHSVVSIHGIVRNVVLVLFVLVGPVGVSAQQDSTVEWKLSLQDLGHRLADLSSENTGGVEVWRADAEDLRSSLVSFAASHPEMQIEVPESLSEKPPVEALKQQLDKLTTAVDQIIRQSPGSPFHLGTVNVVVSAEASTPALVSDSIDHTEIDQHNFLNIAKAFDYLPGVEIEHIAPRNEAGIRVRGFTTRGQVPFYLDGIPISVPYDGYVDFNRFLTSDIAELEVTKGYSSPLLGPNALGGTINLVTNEPVKKLEGEALIGTGSGDTLLSSLRLGSRWQHFFVQGSLDRLQDDFTPLSGNFQVHQYAKLPDITMTDHLNHSGTVDSRYSGRVGWTPRGEDEYVFSMINQKGQKGVPLYQGPNTAAAFPRFWLWPYWDMNSYYFHSTTALGEMSSINFRGFYNQFKNAIDMFSNDTYTVINTSSAEHSAYDEHTDGASTQFTTRLLSRNVISGSFFFKDDTHKEQGTYPGRSPFPLVEPVLLDRDQQASIGLQDLITITSRLHATAGFSADHFDGLQGEAYNNPLTALVPFTCIASPTNKSVAGCTLHAWNYNPQASLSYQVSKSGNLFVTFADRGRFPMLKDIYSASLGSGLPNPDLKPEHSRNWNIGYSHVFPARTLVQFELFRSDLRNAIESVAVTDPGNPLALTSSIPATALCPTSTTGFCSQDVNIGKEVHEGVELKVQSTPFSRLTVDASYSYLNRTIAYDFAGDLTVNQVHTSVSVLIPLPKNKVVGTASVRLPHQVLALISARYEGGLTLQDTTYAASSPLFFPFGESFATVDLGAIVPIYKQMTVQTGIKNLLDRNYYYVAGYPEEGRNWFLNLRYQF
jgi:iron complex outermembrane recepter protein